MELILYGTESDKNDLLQTLSASPECRYRSTRISDYPDYDSFIAGLGESPPDGIVVAAGGADGMEGVIAARNVWKNVPILWFSDDGGFGAQSYRLDCTYFHQKPLSPQILSAALEKCMKQSICEGEIR